MIEFTNASIKIILEQVVLSDEKSRASSDKVIIDEDLSEIAYWLSTYLIDMSELSRAFYWIIFHSSLLIKTTLTELRILFLVEWNIRMNLFQAREKSSDFKLWSTTEITLPSRSIYTFLAHKRTPRKQIPPYSREILMIKGDFNWTNR